MKFLLPLAAVLLASSCAEPPPSIEVRDAWARATAPGQASGAVYATIVGTGADDRLIRAKTERATAVTLHTSETVDGIARMRMVSELSIPAGEPVALEPGGKHIMLTGLGAPLEAGKELPLELSFAKAGTRKISVKIVAPGSR